MIGTTLSHYRITEKLGAGGMGVVYRAEDTNLDRQVAIKVLPDIFSGDPERMARFEREAKLLASLNHPNIAAIYGLEQAESKRFLVLELVEGETLAQRIARGPLPLDETLDVCRQVAEGVEAAHEKGVIHRDLKPANMKITPEGKVKVLDFGLAKAFQGETAAADASHSPTLTDQMTRPGTILGTAAYMAPEQAKGKAVDKRVDVWAFGCVLFECLTGKRAFEGETVTETLASILKGEPDWQALPSTSPWRVRDLLHRCLRKDPKERLHDIADARIEIGEASVAPPVSEQVSAGKPSRGLIVGGMIGGIFLAIAATAMLTWHLRPVPSLPVVSSTLKIESGYWLAGNSSEGRPTRTAIALAHDGSFIVYSAIPENPGPNAKSKIFVRKLEKLEAVPVAGTEGGINPFLSPDDRWIGFRAGILLKKVPIAGGVPTELAEAPMIFGADWGVDNSIVFSPGANLGLYRILGDGAPPENLTVPDKASEEYGHRLPHYLPDGRGILFTVMGHGLDVQPRLAILDFKTRKWHELMKDAADGRYVRPGHLVFLRQGTLMSVAFDLHSMKIKGEPISAVANVSQALNIPNYGNNTGAGQYSISDSGCLAYVPGGIIPDQEHSLVRIDMNGNVQSAADFKAHFYGPFFSPHGERIAYATFGKKKQIWIYDINRGNRNPLTREGVATNVLWEPPDGKRLVFPWAKSGVVNLWLQPADESSPMQRLATSEYNQTPGSFSPDGSKLAFMETRLETSRDIRVLDMKTLQVTPFLETKALEAWPAFSPDGRWIAFASNESGRLEVWVRPFPGPGGKQPVSNQGGTEPIWSKDGRKLYYRKDAEVWAVDVRIEETFSCGIPVRLFEQRGLAGGEPTRGWDLWPDGKSFLMVKLDERKPQPVTEMILVQNWFEELKRLVPTGK